ncbi:CTLH/CRA C-terminal to lish motif domain-containing protein [Fomitopsis betulina]|nr:CTLH/CRA C-terminal to lish motif domain-containing protein [Fomitopsis betulina]
MSTSKLNTEGVLLFEQPFARVPYENYRKVFRTSQKSIEKELGAVQTAANDIAERAKSSGSDTDEAIKAVEGMGTRVENLKRKLASLQSSVGTPTINVMRERFKHLNSLEDMHSPNDPEFARWADTRLDRWLVDWSLRNNKENTAKMIADDRGIERLVDIELFSDIRRIENALKQRNCTEALVWCSENKSALRKVKNTLEFDLRLQEYIELARAGKRLEAIAHSKKYLLTWQETHLPQIRQAAALLCFPPTTTCSPYKRLYDMSRWNTLIQAFRLAIYNLSTLPSEPLLHLAMYAGLASLKLPACYDSHTKNVDCPVCDPSIGKLAEEVPFSHHVNSTIVCRITGRIMDEDNTPLAFPNSGQVYSKEALEDMAARREGTVKDPETGETCEFHALRRLFIS